MVNTTYFYGSMSKDHGAYIPKAGDELSDLYKRILERPDCVLKPYAKPMFPARMDREIRGERDAAFQFIKKGHPEAITQVSRELREDKSFICDVLRDSPESYEFLKPNMQRDPEVIDAYAYGMQTNKSHIYHYIPEYMNSDPIPFEDEFRIEQSNRSMFIEAIPRFRHAVSEACDKNRFYSVENYRAAYESVVLRPSAMVPHEDIFYGNSQLAYLYMANLEMPHMRDAYDLVEAETIINHIESFLTDISRCPEYDKGQKTIALLNHVSDRLKDLGYRETAEQVDRQIAEAITKYRLKRAEELTNALAAYNATMHEHGYHSTALINLDSMFLEAMRYPEMGVPVDVIDDWWLKRGFDVYNYTKVGGHERLLPSTMEYFLKLEMKLIDEFGSQTMRFVAQNGVDPASYQQAHSIIDQIVAISQDDVSAAYRCEETILRIAESIMRGESLDAILQNELEFVRVSQACSNQSYCDDGREPS